jgi:TonB family protein
MPPRRTRTILGEAYNTNPMLIGPKRPPVPQGHEPQFAVAWGPRRNYFSNLRALLGGPKAPCESPKGAYFGSNWVRSGFPLRGVLAALLIHLFVIVFPWPRWNLGAHPIAIAEAASPHFELTWETPARDLPPLPTPGPAAKPSPPGEPDKPLPLRGADAFHPRQTIISAPKLPTHPRQTLIQPDAPRIAPKILPPLPNIVQWSQVSQPARPKLQIDPRVLARLRPKTPVQRPQQDIAVPDVPNGEQRVGDINIATSELSTQKPLMPVPAMSVPQAGPSRAGEESAAAPELGPNLSAGAEGAQRLIALSVTPAAELKAPVPLGNLQSRVTISPDGPQPGVPGGSPNGTPGANGNAGGAANSPGGTGSGGGGKPGPGIPGVSISGGNLNSASNVSGLGTGANKPASLPPNHTPASPPADRTPPSPGFDHIKAGESPESIFDSKRVYTLHVNMPNLTSVTGSWILSFVEMPTDGAPSEIQLDARLGLPQPKPAEDLAGPVPLRKVDPKYPPALVQAHVEGEVVLYAIIRRDGSVDSIQVVRGIDPDLDQNAMQALARWKFRPAERQGAPVELEAIIHIPFRSIVHNF